MQIELIKIKTKPTLSFIKQLQEATYIEMKDALENGGVLGYVNLVGPDKQRVFIIKSGEYYRSVINRTWKLSNNREEPAIVHSMPGKKMLRKPFSELSSAIGWIEAFSHIKEVALKTQIFI